MKKTDLAILFLLFIYLFLAAKDILLPGVNFDEVLNACTAVDFLRTGKIPLMHHPYTPPLESYILIPFFILGRINVVSLRMASIFFGMMTLIFGYLFAKEFFNRKAAFFTTLLLVTSPYFVISTKVGNYLHSYWLFFALSAMLCLLRWYQKGKMIYFLLGAFLLGLGLSAISWFIIFIIGLLVLALIFKKDVKARIQKGGCKSNWLYFVSGLLMLCLGDFLFIYANFFDRNSRFMTFKWILSHFRNTGQGVDNLSYLTNLGSRFKNLLGLLQEKYLLISSPYKESNNSYLVMVFFSVLIWLAFSLFFRKDTYFRKKRIVFLLILIFVVFLVSPFTVTVFQTFHLFILIPFIKLTVSIGLIEFVEFFKNKILKRISWGIVFVLLLILIGQNSRIFKDYYAHMRKTGGEGVWSDAIYELSPWIKETKPSKIVALNVALFDNLYFLMRGNKSIDNPYDFWHMYKPDNKEEIIKRFKTFFESKDTIYLLNIEGHEGKQRIGLFVKTFKEAVKAVNKTLVEEKIFYQRNGKPVYIAYSVK